MRNFLNSFVCKVIVITLILVQFFFIHADDVYAADGDLNWNGVTLECIYSDGGLYEYSYNEYLDENGSDNPYVINRYSYDLKGVSSEEKYQNSRFVYLSNPRDVNETYYKCYDYVHITSMSSSKEAETSEVETLVVFDNASTYDWNHKAEWNIGNLLLSFVNPSLGLFSAFLDDFLKDATLNNNNRNYKLVAENYILTDNSGDPKAVLNFKKEKENATDEQAVANPDYVNILVYNNAVLVEGNNKTNILPDSSYSDLKITNTKTGKLNRDLNSEERVLFLTDAESKVYTTTASTASYYYDSPRYSIADENNGDRYVYNGIYDESSATSVGSLCEEVMPETAKVLAKIIGWCQLLIPALLIILTALDIGKIVVSGNLDEDLPKQNKRIVKRFIAALVIFFLPLIIRLVLSQVADSGSEDEEINSIQYIDCIFELI